MSGHRVGDRAEIFGAAGVVDASREAEARACATKVHANDADASAIKSGGDAENVKRFRRAAEAMDHQSERVAVSPVFGDGVKGEEAVVSIHLDLNAGGWEGTLGADEVAAGNSLEMA